jgi:LysR family glycine cleavage system transcriptional activator
MLRRRLPPLNAMRAFEAAARHLSFTKAADELAVTQAAVSHQVKSLEDWLGRPLFRRRNRAVYLTEDGQQYLRELTEALDLMTDATRRILAGGDGGVLTVSVLPSFATKWLVPRLGDFRNLRPDIDVRISANPDREDFRSSDVDLAIRAGSGEWDDVHKQHLMTEDLYPVCSPRLLQGPNPLRTPADLVHHTLLQDDDDRDEWRVWLTMAGVDWQAAGIDPGRGTRFDDSSMLLQAAIEGQGIAIGRSALAETDIRISLLAMQLGYSEVSAFNHAFSRLEGRSPRSYRRRVRATAPVRMNESC